MEREGRLGQKSPQLGWQEMGKTEERGRKWPTDPRAGSSEMSLHTLLHLVLLTP